MSAERIELNGGKPDPAALAWLAQVNYGHFTTLQVQQRGARGFRLHLQRLADATRELFGSELDLERVRALGIPIVRTPLGGDDPARFSPTRLCELLVSLA